MPLHVLGGLGGLIYVIRKLQQVSPATEPAGCDRALLAFHGHSLAVPALTALDKTLTDAISGGSVSQADLTMDGHSTGLDGRAGVFDSYKKAGDVAVHYRRHDDLCRVSGGLRIPAQRYSRLAQTVSTASPTSQS